MHLSQRKKNPSYLGGAPSLDRLPVPEFRRGMVGCVADFSLGQIYNVDLVKDATDGQNVEDCDAAFK